MAVESGQNILLAVRDLGCQRGGRQILSNLSFDLAPGQFLQLTGPNGSGKTSLLRVLAGLLPASGGAVDRQAEFAYLGHLDGMKAALTGRENLQMAAGMAGRTRCADEIAEVLMAAGLGQQADVPVRHYSAGMRRRLALACLRLVPGNLWLLDEPMTSLDESGQSLFVDLLRQHLASGGAAIIATHQDLALAGTRQLVLGQD